MRSGDCAARAGARGGQCGEGNAWRGQSAAGHCAATAGRGEGNAWRGNARQGNVRRQQCGARTNERRVACASIRKKIGTPTEFALPQIPDHPDVALHRVFSECDVAAVGRRHGILHVDQSLVQQRHLAIE